MKNLFLSVLALFISTLVFSQAPDSFSYQSIVKNTDGNLLQEQDLGVKISILQTSATGTPIYSETHAITTNTNGLLTLEIGSGTSTDNFSSINWGSGSYYLKTEIDPTGGATYTINGTSQLLSVPYALHAKTVEQVDDADANPSNEIQSLSVSNDSLSISKGNTVVLPSSYSKLTAKDTLSVGISGMPILGITEVTGTTHASQNYVEIDFPAGYTNYDSYVLSLQLLSSSMISSTRYGLGYTGSDGTVGYRLTSVLGTKKIVIMYPTSLRNRKFSLVLMKYK